MKACTFTLRELEDRLPMNAEDTLHSVTFVKRFGRLANVIRCRISTPGYEVAPNCTSETTASLWEQLLDLDGEIVAIVQEGDEVTITTDAADDEPGSLTYRLYEAARQIVEDTRCWTAGRAITIWRGVLGRSCYEAYIRHTSQDLLLGLRDGKPDRAVEVRVSHLNLASGPFWPFILTREDYAAWAEEAWALLANEHDLDKYSTIVPGTDVLPGGRR
jgi:hypothetical protein